MVKNTISNSPFTHFLGQTRGRVEGMEKILSLLDSNTAAEIKKRLSACS
jgi:hypothetical protein